MTSEGKRIASEGPCLVNKEQVAKGCGDRFGPAGKVFVWVAEQLDVHCQDTVLFGGG